MIPIEFLLPNQPANLVSISEINEVVLCLMQIWFNHPHNVNGWIIFLYSRWSGFNFPVDPYELLNIKRNWLDERINQKYRFLIISVAMQ